MQRLLAWLLMIAFAAAAPATVACRLAIAHGECCCDTPAAGVVCAPDCCKSPRVTQPMLGATLRLRGSVIAAASSLHLVVGRCDSTPRPSSVLPRAGVGLHERASPRLPLRI